MTVPHHILPLLSLYAARGERAYPVGGCVRDSLMGIPPHDWDVAVTTLPEDTVAICEAAGYRTVPTGIKHGTITVLVPHSGIPTDRESPYDPVECTTCRTEGGYSDGRHPDAVAFTGRIADDLSRRDFTVNAMAFDGDGEHLSVLDLFGGQADLQAGIIRAVGDPDTRFTEDGLRLLRAVRFAVKLGFSLDPATRAAVIRRAEGLARISRERISEELRKILTSPRPEQGIALLEELGLMPYVLPCGISPEGAGRLSALPAEFPLRMACLLWGMTDADLEQNLGGLRLPNGVRKQIFGLVRQPALPANPTPPAARRWRAALGELSLPALAVRAAREDPPSPTLARMTELTAASQEAGDPVRLADLAVNGGDLIALGYKPGRELQARLSALLEWVMDDPAGNTPESLRRELLRREGDREE